MNAVISWLWLILDACIDLLSQPFYYIGIIIIALWYRRQGMLERKLLHVRLNAWPLLTARAVFTGILMGIVISILYLFLGIQLSWQGVMLIWVTSFILMLFRVRYLNTVYAISILGLIQWIIGFINNWQPEGWIGSIILEIERLDISALLVLSAVLHLFHALIVRLQRGQGSSPVYFEGKRGKLVGGYQMQYFIPIPLMLLVPAISGSGATLPWNPAFTGGTGEFMLFGLPLLIGFGEMTKSMLPEEKVSLTSKRIFLYGVVLLVLGLLSMWWSPISIVAIVFAFLGHEALVWISSYEEENRSPIYVHPKQGLQILAILPGSPAEELGMAPGEVIYKVNGQIIQSPADLHRGLRMNPAFCKLEVRNINGESKFLQRAIYEGEHHQLGALLAPDPDTGSAIKERPVSIYQIFGMKLQTQRKTDPNEGFADAFRQDM
ncbi:PDZ domain-containing protein [Paenibacillus sp. Marseille-Q4541]|uniref:PDZ domain-containing protein n=1 Tax=Paenibacillus sp. Marseille-Q4541 TaxID=2831522 RepID=UPI001BAA5CDE|nr:PDZ domain-containing protein [Paenibacillus sp. Marseille-Q4541]